jgi:hypothetical protein
VVEEVNLVNAKLDVRHTTIMVVILVNCGGSHELGVRSSVYLVINRDSRRVESEIVEHVIETIDTVVNPCATNHGATLRSK